MALHVTMVEDMIRKNGTLIPRVVETDTLPDEMLWNYVCHNTALHEGDVQVVLNRFAKALSFFLCQGYRIKTPFGTFRMGVSTVKDEMNPREPRIDRDSLRINYRAAKSILSALREHCEIEIEPSIPRQLPVVNFALNLHEEALVNQAAAGQMIGIRGSRLSLNVKDPEQGVFFVNGDPAGIRSELLTRHGSRLIDCLVPALAPGEYSLEVRTRPTDKELRIGAAPAQFTVTA